MGSVPGWASLPFHRWLPASKCKLRKTWDHQLDFLYMTAWALTLLMCWLADELRMQSYIAAKSGQILDGVSMPQPLEEPRGAGCHTTQAQKTRGTMFTTGQVKHLNDLRPGNIVVESEFMLAVHEVFTQMNRSKQKGLLLDRKYRRCLTLRCPSHSLQ